MIDEKKPTSLDRKPEAAQKEEVPKVDAEVVPVGEPKKKRRRDRKLAAGAAARNRRIRHGKIVDPRINWPSPAEGQHAVRK
jgi:hypothetical protein